MGKGEETGGQECAVDTGLRSQATLVPLGFEVWHAHSMAQTRRFSCTLLSSARLDVPCCCKPVLYTECNALRLAAVAPQREQGAFFSLYRQGRHLKRVFLVPSKP